MPLYASSTVSYEAATYMTAVHNVDGIKLLKDGSCVFMLYGHHLRRSVEIMRDEDGVDLAVEPLRMHYAFCVYDKRNSPALAVRLSEIANVSVATVRHEATFTKKI